MRDAGFIDDAIAEYNRIGKTDREYGLKVMFRLARLYVDIRRYEEAIGTLQDSLKLDLGREMEAYVYGELGYVFKEQKHFEAALASYRRSLELQPGSEASLDGIRLVEQEMDRYSE